MTLFLKRISVFFCPLLTFLGLELLFYNIKLIYILLIVVSIVLIVFLKFLIDGKFISQEFWWLAILPLLLFYDTVSFLFLIGSDFIRHIVIVIFVLILMLYLENIFLYFHRPIKYKPFSLENLSAFLIILVFFLTAINLNAFYIFLSLPLWLISLILLTITCLLLCQAFWINKIKNNFKFVYLIIINIIILELFWALAFLPTNFYVNGIILTILFYFIWGIFKIKLVSKLEKKNIWRYLIISSILLILVIITSPWA